MLPHLPPADHRTRQAHESLVDIRATVVARAQSSELVQPADCPLDRPAVLARAAPVLCSAARDPRCNVATRQRHPVRITVITSIRNNTTRRAQRRADLPPDRRDRVNRRDQLRAVVAVGLPGANRIDTLSDQYAIQIKHKTGAGNIIASRICGSSGTVCGEDYLEQLREQAFDSERRLPMLITNRPISQGLQDLLSAPGKVEITWIQVAD